MWVDYLRCAALVADSAWIKSSPEAEGSTAFFVANVDLKRNQALPALPGL